MELVWFKRDLRISDHSPLVAASRHGPIVCLYIYEPELIGAEDFSRRHLLFINDSLRALDTALRKLGARLVIRTGDAVTVMADLHDRLGFKRLRTHQETTNGISYRRDLAVNTWAADTGVEIIEYRQQGVVRRLGRRDGWASQWQNFVASPLVPAPRSLEDGSSQLDCMGIQEPEQFGLADDGLVRRQRGGEPDAKRVLLSFLKDRCSDYMRGLSSPVTAWDACSRISPYLTYGNLSLREVYQRSARRRQELQRRRGPRDHRAQNLNQFNERLAWHCHFIQKLEDEPRIEFENMNRNYDGLREDDFNSGYYKAWITGRTGYPMIDACMRALIATGWINFRMRAMLISFAAYHLWLHWRQPAVHLARMFLDYEPGIHYSQIQMQAGTTGIAAVRIYSPIKQAQDQDPQGEFIRQWLPELAQVPNEFIAEPHKMPPLIQQASDCLIGTHYPAPIVDHQAAYRVARQRMQAVDKTAKYSAESRRVFARHGSRRRQSVKSRRGQVGE